MTSGVSTAVSRLPRLSVLDLVPVRADQTTADAITATRSLARVADELGYQRYWVAEHHNMPAVAATNPPLLIALLAAGTQRIRLGSGGVMLPNHAPLVVAEQFALLEAAFPGRIDLGLGRAPGTDQITRYVLRGGAAGPDSVDRFPEYVEQVQTLMSPGGAGLDIGGRLHTLNATPRSDGVPPVWLLGSSDYSARLAAERGLPYVFAHHFAGHGTREAIELYRASFQPSPEHPTPQTFLTVNAVVAETDAEAHRLAEPNLRAMVTLRTGQPLRPQPLVEDTEEDPLPPEHLALANGMRRRWVIGSADTARSRIIELAAEFEVDEVMIHPVAGALRGTAPGAAPAREETLRLLAK